MDSGQNQGEGTWEGGHPPEIISVLNTIHNNIAGLTGFVNFTLQREPRSTHAHARIFSTVINNLHLKFDNKVFKIC